MERKAPLGRGLGSLLGMFEDFESKKVANKSEEVVENNETVETTLQDVVNETVQKQQVNEQEIVKNGNVLEIDMKLIDNNPNQPRKNFDATALKELADSIKEHGIIQPIVVVKNNERYMIVAGERRFRASKLVGLKSIPVVVKEYTTEQIKQIALLENIQRQDLNPIETAKGMKELLDVYEWTQEQLADKLGKSRPAVANFLRLLQLCPEVIEMIEKGKLSAGHARSLVVIEDPEVQIKLAKLAVTKKVTVRDLEKAVKEITHPETKKKAPVLSLEVQELVRDMQSVFSTKTSILGTDNRGRIFIDYYNREDLERIYSVIKKLK